MFKLPLETLKATISILSDLPHRKHLNTMGTPLVLATDWQLGKCGSRLSVPVVCTPAFDKFLFQRKGSYYSSCLSERAVQRGTERRLRRGTGLCRHRSAGPGTRGFLTSPESVCLHSASLPSSPTAREDCFLGSLLLHTLLGRKYFYAIKILLVFFTPFSSMQNRKADTLPCMVIKDPDYGS